MAKTITIYELPQKKVLTQFNTPSSPEEVILPVIIAEKNITHVSYDAIEIMRKAIENEIYNGQDNSHDPERKPIWVKRYVEHKLQDRFFATESLRRTVDPNNEKKLICISLITNDNIVEKVYYALDPSLITSVFQNPLISVASNSAYVGKSYNSDFEEIGNFFVFSTNQLPFMINVLNIQPSIASVLETFMSDTNNEGFAFEVLLNNQIKSFWVLSANTPIITPNIKKGNKNDQ